MFVLKCMLITGVYSMIRIVNTNVYSGTLLLQNKGSPYVIILEYPKGMKFDDFEDREDCHSNLQNHEFMQRKTFKINKNLHLMYTKSLCKEFEYSYDIESGIHIKYWIIQSNKVFYGQLLDWMPIPDFSMVCTGSLSLGILLCIVFKLL